MIGLRGARGMPQPAAHTLVPSSECVSGWRCNICRRRAFNKVDGSDWGHRTDSIAATFGRLRRLSRMAYSDAPIPRAARGLAVRRAASSGTEAGALPTAPAPPAAGPDRRASTAPLHPVGRAGQGDCRPVVERPAASRSWADCFQRGRRFPVPVVLASAALVVKVRHPGPASGPPRPGPTCRLAPGARRNRRGPAMPERWDCPRR